MSSINGMINLNKKEIIDANKSKTGITSIHFDSKEFLSEAMVKLSRSIVLEEYYLFGS